MEERSFPPINNPECPMLNYRSYTFQEKWLIINQVKDSSNKKKKLEELGVPRTTYYDWLSHNLRTGSKAPQRVWNKAPEWVDQKVREFRLSGDPLKESPARIMEHLEELGYFITESGVKSIIKRLGLPKLRYPVKKNFYIRPRAEKFFQVLCLDELDFLRFRPHDTNVLNFVDEASYYPVRSTVYGRKINQNDVVKSLKEIKREYNKLPKILRLDNLQVYKSRKVRKYCQKEGIILDYITKGCPEENWPVEVWHRALNQNVIYRNGFAKISDWQRAVDKFREYFINNWRIRSDPILRTPKEIAYAFTTPATQHRLKLKLMRKHYRKVQPDGKIYLNGKRVNLGQEFASQKVFLPALLSVRNV
jgi:transposase